MKQIYIVRHCKAEGQEPEAALTAQGQQQAESLADFFQHIPLERIISSPFKRGLDSVRPLAERRGLPVEQDERLAERVLASGPLSDWLERLRATFDDLQLCYEGGESSQAAMDRAAAVVNDLMASEETHVLLVTHGCLMTLLLKHFDDRFGFSEWQSLTNPDVYLLSGNGEHWEIKRLWKPGTV